MKKVSGKFLNDDFEFVDGEITFENGIFTDIKLKPTANENDEIIVPALIDIHTHGCCGVDLMSSKTDGFNKMSIYMAQNGISVFLPTLLTRSRKEILDAAIQVKKAADKVQGATIAGINIEGPFFGPECIGANDLSSTREPDITEIEDIQKATNDFIRIVSIDPILPGALDFIRHFKDSFKISLGHTPCNFEQAQKAFCAGATNITHTFNGMKPMHHRNPNMLCAAFNGDAYMEIICDGFHVHPEMIKLAYKLAGCDRLVFISDSLSAMGAPEGVYDIGGMTTVVKNGKALLEDGTICGGMTPLYECVLKAVSFGIPFNKAIKCASINSAKAAGIENDYGSISVGKYADFLVVDKNYNIKSVYVKGRKI